MSLESATYATQLNANNPASSDPRSNGDDHLRLIKSVLKQELGLNNREWIYTAHTVVRNGAESFSIASTDLTSVYAAGRRVKVTGNATGTSYSTVTSSTYSSSTSVNLSANAALSNETLAVFVGSEVSPKTYSVSDFGAAGDATIDDTTALNAAFSAATGGILIFPPNRTYNVTGQLVIGANTLVEFNKSVISVVYTTTSASPVIDPGTGCVLRNLEVSVATGFTIRRVISVDDNTVLDGVRVISVDQQNNRTISNDAAIRVAGDNVNVRDAYVKNFDNGVRYESHTRLSMTNLYVENYVRAFNIDTCSYFTVDNFVCTGLSANGTTDPGHNGLLMGDCTYGTVSNVSIRDAGEHGVRVSGSVAFNDLTFSNIQVQRPGQCGFKISGTVVGKDITINGLHVRDCSFGGSSGSNEDGLRIQDATGVAVSNVSVRREDNAGTCAYDGIYIGGTCREISIVGAYINDVANHGIHITDESAANTMSHIHIVSPRIISTLDDAVQIGTATSGSVIADIVITDLYARAITGYVVELNATDTIITNPVIITGYAKGGGAGLENAPGITDTQYVNTVAAVS